MAAIAKIIDTKVIPSSRVDTHWNAAGFKEIYRRFRTGVDIPLKLREKNNAKQIQDSYKLAGFQFGNWTTNEDRYNYLCSLYLALYDMNKVLKFKDNNLGFKALSISFGARGVSRAIAHYENYEQVINITRYERAPGFSKVAAFINSGGIGAFAHEYAHFLDYYFGQHYELKSGSFALTEGRSTNKYRINDRGMRGIIEEILQLAIWKKEGVELSDYYKRIKALSDQPYYVRRNELFARLFEQYISHKLQSIHIYNKFLCVTKYDIRIYMRPNELKKVIPLFDQLVKQMRSFS